MDLSRRSAPPRDLVEVRLLGPLHVRRRDGRIVDHREWRTGKTADLLRLLAIADGQPVTVDRLVEELWPSADETHGRASLRTAASQLRAVLGPETLERRPDGLALHGVWVDAAVYERLALEARRLLRSGDLVDGVRAAREAEAMRLGELTAHEAGAQWAFDVRSAQQGTRLRLLLAAAEAALALDWLGDAGELASAALEVDPASEAAARLLMQSLARTGDRSAELRVYERCRQVLRVELGVDLSPQTEDLHAEIRSGLRGAQRRAVVAPRRESGALACVVEEVRRTGAPTTVRLAGGDCVERRRFVADVCTSVSARLVTAVDVTAGLAAVVSARSIDDPDVWVVCADEPARSGQPADVPDRVLLVVADDGTSPSPDALQVVLQPLLREELQLLAQQVLGDRPEPALLDHLAARAGGSHCRAVDLLQSWLLEGRIRSSRRGMVLVDEAGAVERTAVRTTLARLIERLSTLDLEVLGALAVLDRPIRQEHLVALLGPDQVGPSVQETRGAVERSVAHLADLAVLTLTGTGVALRSAMLADAIRSWLRPSVLRRVHRAVAERATISSADRIVHWCTLGEPELACAAALEAAEAAIDEGRHEDARTHLLQVCYLAGPRIDLTRDGSDVVEQLAQVLVQLDRTGDAERVRARRPGLPAPVMSTLPATLLGGAAGASVLVEVADRRRTAALHAVAPDQTAGAGRPERRGRRQAGHLPDSDLPQLLRPGGALAPVAGHLVELLLGDAEHAEIGLRRARGHGSVEEGSAAAACLDLLLLVVAHDLGRAEPTSGWLDVVSLARLAGPDWAWVPVRILTERWDLPAARAAVLSGRPDVTGGPDAPSELGHQLLLLARAALADAEGDRTAAVGHLVALVGRGVDSGCTVLLPEAAARLALAESGDRFPRAQEHFDLFEWSLGEHEPRPRASSLRLLARAALRRELGDHQRAAAAAAQAHRVALGSGLLPLAAQAQLERARILSANGSSESVTAMALAREAFRAAGIDAPGLRPHRPGPACVPASIVTDVPPACTDAAGTPVLEPA